jgi:chemotaxis protein MotB
MARRNSILLKKPEPAQAQTGGWQIVYTGFILILLCFFIMLTSFASLEQSKITRFAKSFSNAVSVFNAGKGLESGETILGREGGLLDKQDPVALLFEKVRMLGRQSGLEDITIRRSKHGVIMTLTDTLLFDSGDAVLSAGAHELLKKIARIINRMDVQVDIEGHTDDRPISTAAYPSNWELSTARAVNVLRDLISEGHVSSERLSAVGLSAYHPLVANDSTENRAKNRRVEIIFRPETS